MSSSSSCQCMMPFISALVILQLAAPALATLISDSFEVSDAALHAHESKDHSLPARLETEASIDDALSDMAPADTPDIACSGWSPREGELKGQGAYCAKWGADFNWCYVEENYKGFASEFMDKATQVDGKFFVPCPDSVATDHRKFVTLLDSDGKEAKIDEEKVMAKEVEIEQDKSLEAKANNEALALEKEAKEARQKANRVTEQRKTHEEEEKALKNDRDAAELRRSLHRKSVAAHKAKATADSMKYVAATAQADADEAVSEAKDLEEITQALALPTGGESSKSQIAKVGDGDPKEPKGHEVASKSVAPKTLETVSDAEDSIGESRQLVTSPEDTQSLIEDAASVGGDDETLPRTVDDTPQHMTLGEAQALIKKLKLVNNVKADEPTV